MDKIATNNLIVELKTDIKAAKAMVAGNLVRKINELKKALEKDGDDVARAKSENKILSLHRDIKLVKTLDSDLISKNAILKPDPKHWSNLVGDSKATDENKLMGRVILKGRIQKKVKQFRSDHQDCDEWLEEYFEFREKKRELTAAKISKRKTKQTNRNDKPTKGSRTRPDSNGPDRNLKPAKKFNQRGRQMSKRNHGEKSHNR